MCDMHGACCRSTILSLLWGSAHPPSPSPFLLILPSPFLPQLLSTSAGCSTAIWNAPPRMRDGGGDHCAESSPRLRSQATCPLSPDAVFQKPLLPPVAWPRTAGARPWPSALRLPRRASWNGRRGSCRPSSKPSYRCASTHVGAPCVYMCSQGA